MVVVPWIQAWPVLCSCQLTLEWLCSPSLDLQRQIGHWEAVVVAWVEAALWWWLWAASCSMPCSFSSDALTMHISASQLEQTWAAMLSSEGLILHHFRLLFSVSLQHFHSWPWFLCPCACSPKNSCFSMC